jgi:hypothetical protein
MEIVYFCESVVLLSSSFLRESTLKSSIAYKASIPASWSLTSKG